MGRVVLSWIVLEATDSPALLGLNLAARFAPMSLGTFFGIVVDRVSRRRLLMLIQAACLVMDFTLGALITLGQLQYWHTLVASLVYGAENAIGMPARSVLMIDVVGKHSLSDATALTRVSMTSMAFIGPALVAVLVGLTGVGPFYFLMVAIHLTEIASLFLIKVAEEKIPKNESAWKNLVEGLRYHKSRRDITSLQLIALIANMFIFPLVPDLLVPIVAKDVLNVGATGFAWLNAAINLGHLMGSFCVLALSNYARKGWLTAVDSLLWSPLLWLFSVSAWYPLSLVTLFMLGTLTSISMTLVEVLLLVNSPPEIRGRVMGVRMQVITCEFIGNLIWGPALSFISPPLAGLINGGLYMLAMIGIFFWAPSLREMK